LKKQTLSLVLFDTAVLAIFLTILISPAFADYYQDDAWAYGKIFPDCWVHGTLTVVSTDSGYAYAYSADALHFNWFQTVFLGYDMYGPTTSLYQDGNGRTLKISASFWETNTRYHMIETVILYMHFDEGSQTFHSWSQTIP
jgi:hypothetical protein